ncbi:MAG: glycosyltransferase family 2 protein [Cyanobacteria bacterium J06576_12]
MLPLVNAIVPTRNRKALTLRFLAALSQQDYPQLQVVVVDSASSDGTPDAVRAHFPKVQVLEVSDRNYWTGATNHGVRHALDQGSEYILTINDDSVITSSHISRMVSLTTRYAIAILGNRIDYLAEPGRIWSLGTQVNWNQPKMITLRYQDHLADTLPPDVLKSDVLPVDTLPGNGVLIHRHVFETVGLYNAYCLPHYHADSELVLRAKRAGMSAYVAPNIILLNDFSKTQKQLHLNSLGGVYQTFFHPKSHLFLPPLLYLFFRYCWAPFRSCQ